MIMDGLTVNSCLVAAEVNGKNITTIEGLSKMVNFIPFRKASLKKVPYSVVLYSGNDFICQSLLDRILNPPMRKLK